VNLYLDSEAYDVLESLRKRYPDQRRGGIVKRGLLGLLVANGAGPEYDAQRIACELRAIADAVEKGA